MTRVIDLSRCRLPPFAHQAVGIQALVDNPFFFLADEMGAGKTKQVIDAAQILFTHGVIDKLLIVAPASVRSVWFDEMLGELAKHLWTNLPARVTEFHSRTREWTHGPPDNSPLRICVVNYEFIRSKTRLNQLMAFAGPKTLLVLDESTAVKSATAAQTKACLQLRRACGRVVLLNGTPIANSPADMFSQGNILDPSILACKSYFQFRSRYAIMGGWMSKVIIGWRDLEDLQRRFKPYVLRRLKKDCLDLPEAMPPVTLTVTLTEGTWKIYKEMRDEMVAWLSDTTVAVASQAAVKSMRLRQITSGYLGGIEDAHLLADDITADAADDQNTTREVGREKLEFLLEWHAERLKEDPNLKLLTWCCFRPELARLMGVAADHAEHYRIHHPAQPEVTLGYIAGGQKPEERAAALRLLDPRTAPEGPVFFGGTYGTGSFGHNFTACHTVVNLSSDYSPWKYSQAAARVDRPGQVHAVSYYDVVAVGPQGQRTIDSVVVQARRLKEDLATWTCEAWVKALREE